MGSVRLKNKVLRKIRGRTLIEHIFSRLRRARELDGIVLSTSLQEDNDVLAKYAENIGLKYYRGDETDLVSRFYNTARKFKADAVVRITGDCPLVDPRLADKMVKIYRENHGKIDFMTNVFPPTFPDGLDIDILPILTLKRLNSELKNPLHREWLTAYIMENPEKFRIRNLKNSVNLSSVRLTVDYPEDLILVGEIFKALGEKNDFTADDIVKFLKENPHISKINANRIDKTIIGNIRSGVYHKLKLLDNDNVFKTKK